LLRAVSAVAGAPDAADFADRVLWGLRGNIALHLLHFPGWEEGIPELWSFLRVLATCGTRATERFVRFVADGLANVLDSIDVEHDRGFSGLANLLTMVDAFLSSNAPVSLSRLSFAHFLLRVIAETPDPLSGETALRICQDRMTPDDFSALVDPAWLPAVMVHRPELESAAISIAYDVFSRASDVDDWVNYAAEVFGLGGKESEVQLPQPCKVFYAVCISVGCTTIPGLDLPPAAVFLPLLVDLLGSLMPPGLDAGLLLSLLEQYASLSYDDEETCEIFIEALDDTIAEAALAEYGEKGLDIVESVRNAAQALSDSRNYT
jgi:hypothetical protein